MKGRAKATSGWTLIEALVAIGLLSVVMAIATYWLIATARVTQSQNRRSLRQAMLQGVVQRVERTIRQSAVSAIAWRTGSNGAVLAVHQLDGAPMSGGPRMNPFWDCFVWSRTDMTLVAGQSLTSGSLAPNVGRFQPMPGAQIDAIMAGEIPTNGTLVQGRRIADRITDFVYTVESGPTIKLFLEIEVPNSEDPGAAVAKERLRATTSVHPRNRS